MNGMFLTQEQFEVLQERYQDWKAQGFPEVDKHVLPVVERFNALPGVVTLSSCIGHQHTKLKVKHPFYLSCAVTEEGAQHVRRIYSAMGKRLVEMINIYNAIHASKRGGISPPSHSHIPYTELQLTESHRDLELHPGESIVYNRLMLVAKGTHLPGHRDNFVREITAAVDRLLEKENKE